MKILLLFLLLLVPSAAFAQATYDLSCGNVARIRIFRLKAAGWQIDTPQGYFHILALDLTPDAAQGFGKRLKTAPMTHFQYNGMNLRKENLTITANGGSLRNDTPAMTGFSDQGIDIAIIREQDAFDAARSVCPALVPAKVLEDGKWE
jgi:hypothetical protein